ncbi:N-formylglutamate amidohydrolase [Burkholderia pseudomallei]|nr:N-formylglutamate amidohydrolase [Burkholderia pseudomallei]ARK56157.1 N-formylglutamate amidohydrolase [Burkholderia pseudomallei]ARL25345.1 N-formylglutamate amidohydrolase [Burkholderia pseudomallei]ARL33034.1 N-formylglutamate amidohydrolase [Burkholderia pseudomallei]ARL77458.1 N-formylglutamate amidohydrolase [Burkholderia pseudomallei]
MLTFNRHTVALDERFACFVAQPLDAALPIVVDSPHSGIAYPPDFGAVAPRHAILTSWDAFVDELWAGAPERGCALVGARFARAYIDPNRAVTDIDAALLAEPWPEPLAPQSYTRRGMGLIRRYALPGVPLYDRKLSLDEVRHRIDTYYLPYRRALADAAEPLYAKHGALWHVDCHSMKSRGNAMNLDAGAARPDVVVSDRLGTSADPAFTQWTADWFAHAGYRVRINAPYQGGDLLNALAAPARRRHSIQIEFNRALYMNEAAFDKHAGFAALKRTVDAYLDALAAHVRTQLPPPRGQGVSR